MKTMKTSALIIVSAVLSCASYICPAQDTISGRVITPKGDPVFAATVVLTSDSGIWTSSDMDGYFTLAVPSGQDTLHFICMGYKDLYVPVETAISGHIRDFILKEDLITLQGVTVTAKNPISERSATAIINTMDIYMNPVSQADPLKAISLLPSHTGVDESANPSFRGSRADRSIVTLNGVPVYNPVRSSQLNNQGFFSIFNPEVMENEYVHPGNPPLTYGNTSAGLVEIETAGSIGQDQLQMSLSLASAGLFLSKRIKNGRSFIQAWSNYQFSDAFIGIQRKYYPEIQHFWNADAGINFYGRIGKHTELKSYAYFLKEGYDGRDGSLNYYGPVTYGNTRALSANSLRHISGIHTVSLNFGADWSNPGTTFGNILSKETKTQAFASLNYKLLLHPDLNIQTGISLEHLRYSLHGRFPAYFYALSPEAPTAPIDAASACTLLEAYAYSNWDITQKLLLTAAVRSNIPVTNGQKWYLSGQLSLKYSFRPDHYLKLSGGRYNSHSMPNYYLWTFNHLTSNQLSLDYSLRAGNTALDAAVYIKNEDGRTAKGMEIFETTDRADILGVEAAFSQIFLKNFKFSISNTFIRQRVMIDSVFYRGPENLAWFIKSSIEYSNPELFTIALSYTTRPGTLYSSVSGSAFIHETGTYMPLYSDWYDTGYPAYHRLDLTLNKYIPLGRCALTLYLSVNNLLDTKNPAKILYNTDYTFRSYLYLQRRSFYFGLVFTLKSSHS